MLRTFRLSVLSPVIVFVACLLFPYMGLAKSQGRFTGVGAVIQVERDGSLVITRVLPNGPAFRAGIRAGDELLAVNGRSVAAVPLDEVVAMVRGPQGTKVTLTVRREGQRPQRLTMRRATISIATGGEANGQGVAAPAGSQPPEPASTPQRPRGTLKFTRISIRAPTFGNIEAVSFLIPAGWRTQGGIVSLPNYSVLANLRLRITDPDSGAEIQFLPVQNFTYMQRTVMPIRPGSDYLGDIFWPPIYNVPRFIRTFYMPRALRHLQSARIIQVENLPNVAATVARASGNGSMARSVRVRYAYTRDGQPWEEDVFVTLAYTRWQMITVWSVHSAYALRAPRALFASLEPVMAATVSSKHISLAWYANYRYVQKLFQERVRQGIADAGAISRTISRNSEEIERMYDESYQKSSATWDRINRNFDEYIRGVKSYQDPYKGHSVELPSGYSNAWVDAGGDYILSNDANYNPNVGHTVEWRRIKGGAGQ